MLAAVDVEGCAGDRGVGHEVDGRRGDVGRPDDAADRQRGAELLAALVDLIAEQRGRRRRVDKACNRSPSQMLHTAAPWTSPWLLPGYEQNSWNAALAFGVFDPEFARRHAIGGPEALGEM